MINLILRFVEHFVLTDLIDVIIVSYIIYHFLLIIRGTKAVQMVVGVGILLVMYYLSLSFKFFSLNWLLAKFFDNLFVILVIIFQDNIRNTLASVGGLSVFWKSKTGQRDAAIEEIVAAAGAMSREKTGALIVFERSQGLLNFKLSGTILDSHLHSDILYSIFQKNSPLHDGAVIISEGKIGAAGCYLPLSKNVDIDRHLGTRHRAAMGISEISDALVVTVSEETGTIRICNKGVFYDMKDENSLRINLKSILIHDLKELSMSFPGVSR